MLAGDALVRRLNRDYRGRDETTNVLSFPGAETIAPGTFREPSQGMPLVLGDVIVAFHTARQEAAAQSKPLGDHLSHLIAHGVLHLAGFDHGTDDEAKIMEALETAILADLGVPDPYAERPLVAS